jgi:hypothetical protein
VSTKGDAAMKTIIDYKDGRHEVIEDAMPSPYCDEFSCIDENAEIVLDTVPLDTIRRVVFIND